MNIAAWFVAITVGAVAIWIAAIASRKAFLKPEDHVWIFGDSLGVGLLPRLIKNGTAAGIQVAGNPKGGTIVLQWAQKSDLLAGPQDFGATVAIVILGSNDAASQDGYINNELSLNADQLVARLREAGMRVVWLIPGAPPGLPKASRVNSIIQGRAFFVDFTVLDPSDLPVQYQPYDGIHPTPAGYDALAAWIFDQLTK